MESQGSDEEDDRQHFIEQNDAVKSQSPRRHSPPTRRHSPFRIDDDIHSRLSSGAARVFKLRFNKLYLFASFLPLFILVLYFTTDVRHVFKTGVSGLQYDSSATRMRGAELQALYLLKQQRLGLLKLFNHTSVNNNNNNKYDNDNLMTSGSFSSALLDNLLGQISLNKRIQQVLLSSHGSTDLLDLSDGDNFTKWSVGGWNRCRKSDQRFSARRTIEWRPRSNKYLFAICTSGQMSNHLICLEKHMFFAAVLKRVLVIPSAKIDYEFHRVLDIDHINKCAGSKVVVTFEEFAESRKKHVHAHVHINKFICYFSLPQPCFMDDEHVKKLKSLGVSMPKLEAAWVEDVSKPANRTMQDVVAKFSSDDDVIAIGDVFFADVEREWVMQPGGPIAHNCKTLIEPSRLIMLTAQRFIQTFLGKNFIALHFRRHGFLKFCNVKKSSCFYPVPQAAECINRVVERAHAPVIYLSTDAAHSETDLLQSLVVFNGKTVPLVKRPPRNSAEKWDALLYRHHIEGDPQVEAMLDKTICALSSVFIGSSGSTFTEDILRLRKDWGSASLCDEYLCQGEVPNFIAENELRR